MSTNAWILVAMLCVAAVAGATEDRPTPDSPVTFSEHIAPVIFDNCTSCHRPGEVAPFPLMSYRDVQKRGRMIRMVIEDRYMPPWHPVKGHGDFEGELRLDPREIERFGAWVDAGMPVGDSAKLPPLPEFTEGWQIGEPDLVVRMKEGYSVPAGGPDIYRNFAVPLDLDEDKWLTAIEVRPGARTVLHHIVFGLDTSGEARRMDGADGEPGFFGMQRSRSNVGTSTAGLGGWAVGGMPRKLPMGLAVRIPKGTDLILRSHFHPSGKAETEQTTIGLHFTDTPPTRTMVGLQLPPVFGYAAGIDVPAGEPHFQIEDSFTLPVDAVAVTVGGHAHYICSEMQILATAPRGRAESIFYIDEWDFSWQNRYLYREPLELSAGTRIDARVSYDNSAGNPDNPFDPPRRISWGLQSTDEMGSVTLLLVAKREEDTARLQNAIREHVREGLSNSRARQSMVSSFVTRLRMLDRDDDGKIEREEIPDRMRAYARRMDTNGDGAIDAQELDAVAERTGAGGASRVAGTRPASNESGPANARAKESPDSRGPVVRDVHGWAHHPLERSEAKASVLIFTTVDCPIANSYSPELRSILADHAKDRIRFYLVHVDQDVTAERAKKHAAEYGLAATLLLDPEHELVRRTSASITPEVAVVLPDGEIVYRGRIDNWYGGLGKKRPEPTKRELRDVVRAVLDDKPIETARTDAIGCTITEPIVR